MKSKKRKSDLLHGQDEDRAAMYARLTPTERVRWLEKNWRLAAELKARAAQSRASRKA